MNEQTYYRIDDAVFICEQQFMAMLIQMPSPSTVSGSRV